MLSQSEIAATQFRLLRSLIERTATPGPTATASLLNVIDGWKMMFRWLLQPDQFQ
jgi:hypothetical protein